MEIKDVKVINSLEDIFKLTNILTNAIVVLRDEDLEEYIITCIVNKMDANEDLFNIFKGS